MDDQKPSTSGLTNLTAIRREFGNEPRLAPALFLQNFKHDEDEVVAVKGPSGGTFASARIAQAYREHLQRITDPSWTVHRVQRRSLAGYVYSVSGLAEIAGTHPTTLKERMMRYGMAYPERRQSYANDHLRPTIHGDKFAQKINGEWRWKASVLKKIGL